MKKTEFSADITVFGYSIFHNNEYLCGKFIPISGAVDSNRLITVYAEKAEQEIDRILKASTKRAKR